MTYEFINQWMLVKKVIKKPSIKKLIITPQMLNAFEAFLATQQCVSPNTYAAYLRDLRQLQKFQEQHTRYELREMFIAFREHMYDQGIGARSIARKLSAFRCFFKFVRERYPRKLPEHIMEIMGHMPKLEKKLPRICSVEEIHTMIAAAATDEGPHRLRNQLMCILLYTTGLRVSELVNLRIENVDTTLQLLRITGKGGRVRLVPVVESTYRLIMEYIAYTRPTTYIFFTDSPDHPLCRQTAWRVIRRLAQQAGVLHTVSPHILRHSLATHSLENGWDLRSLQMMLGHERIATTEHYIHLDTAFVKKEYRKRHPRK